MNLQSLLQIQNTKQQTTKKRYESSVGRGKDFTQQFENNHKSYIDQNVKNVASQVKQSKKEERQEYNKIEPQKSNLMPIILRQTKEERNYMLNTITKDLGILINTAQNKKQKDIINKTYRPTRTRYNSITPQNINLKDIKQTKDFKNQLSHSVQQSPKHLAQVDKEHLQNIIQKSENEVMQKKIFLYEDQKKLAEKLDRSNKSRRMLIENFIHNKEKVLTEENNKKIEQEEILQMKQDANTRRKKLLVSRKPFVNTLQELKQLSSAQQKNFLQIFGDIFQQEQKSQKLQK